MALEILGVEVNEAVYAKAGPRLPLELRPERSLKEADVRSILSLPKEESSRRRP